MPKKKEPPIQLKKNPRYEIGYDEDEAWVDDHVNPFFNHQWAGNILELVQQNATFIRRMSRKRAMQCPMSRCMWETHTSYRYRNFKWSAMLCHLIMRHNYEPPIHFLRFLWIMNIELRTSGSLRG